MTFPWVVADVGGTNARFGLIEELGKAPSHVRTLLTREHDGLGEAAAAYLEEIDAKPGAGCLAVAGPVAEGRIHLTNADWRPDSVDAIRKRLSLPTLQIINDFEALALALPSLKREDDLLPFGGTSPSPDGKAPLAVLGPGTGLGVASLVPVDGGWVPVPGEGGHVDLPCATDREVELMRLVRAETNAGGAEQLLSGDGIARIHRFLATIDGIQAEPSTAAEICGATDPLASETIAVFCALLGSFAGNAALTLGARGGVYLGGGILPRIADALARSDFRERFEGKPPVEGYLRAIPTALIVHPGPALLGAAALLTRLTQDRPLELA